MLKISVVSYLNSIPFIYGIEQSCFLNNYSLEVDVPSSCATKLIENKTDIGLIPIAALVKMRDYHIIGNHCIGANGAVKTVILASNQEKQNIHTIYLDPDSKTSVQLIKILAKEYWKQKFQWKTWNPKQKINKGEAVVLIGDKTHQYIPYYSTIYDLSEEWKKHTNLPFVFACWVANKPIEKQIELDFIRAITFGVEHKSEAIEKYYPDDKNKTQKLDYLSNYISYDFDNEKKEAMELFISYIPFV